jgi:eukaryotic-like serine/threonine-protein kinase
MHIASEIRFVLGDNIGGAEGRNSQVYKAHDPQLKAELVVKAIPLTAFDHPDEYFAEAQMLYESRHPNVVEVKYACRDHENVYLAMPWYEGGSVHGLLGRRFLTVREIVKYATDFMAGLHRIHTKNLVHFDVKPTNVLIDGTGKAAITDFGLTKYVNAEGLAEQPKVYVSHLPPEVFRETMRGAESDIYQAGLTLYRMCNGLDAFEHQWNALPDHPAKVQAILTGSFPNRAAYLPHIPSRIRTAIKKALDPDPAQRYGEILDFMNDLAPVSDWLDWEYLPDPGAGVQRWEMNAETHRKRVELAGAGAPWSVTCTRINHESGRTQTVRALSGEHRTLASATRAVQKALTEL